MNCSCRCQDSLRQQRAFCLGRFDPLTQFMHSSTAEARSTLQLHCHKMRPNSNGTQLLQAYDAVAKGDALCAAAAGASCGSLDTAKQQCAEAARQYKLAADLGCAAGMFHYAQLLRLGLADVLLPDGSAAVNSQAAQQLIEQAMQQELLLNLPLQEPARTCLTVVNEGMPESWVLAGDLHCAGLWGTAAASNSLQEAMQAYQKAVQLANLPPAFAGIGRLEEMQGDEEAALTWYSKAANKQYSAAELGLPKLLAAAIKNDDSGTMVRAEKRAALLAVMKAAKHGLPRAKALAGTLEEDASKAAVLLQEAVEEDGHPECLLALALAYAYGLHGLPRCVVQNRVSGHASLLVPFLFADHLFRVRAVHPDSEEGACTHGSACSAGIVALAGDGAWRRLCLPFPTCVAARPPSSLSFLHTHGFDCCLNSVGTMPRGCSCCSRQHCKKDGRKHWTTWATHTQAASGA